MVTKQEIDVEKLLQWAYRDELPKNQISAAEGIWNNIQDYGQRGGIDLGQGAAQRYSHFGLPDPDALTVEKAVNQIVEDFAFDWSVALGPIAGPIAGLVTVNDVTRRPETTKRTTSGWTDKKTGRWTEVEDKPRDLMMVRTMRAKALVIMHANMGTRPPWHDEQPLPYPTPAAKGPNPKIIGSSEGKNRYSLGTYCPVRWSPSPVSVILERAEYIAWWEALNDLAAALEKDEGQLKRFKVLPPAAPWAPWALRPVDAEAATVIHLPSDDGADRPLPLSPERGRMLAPFRYRKAGPVRHVLDQEASR